MEPSTEQTLRLGLDPDPDVRERSPVLLLLHGINQDRSIWRGARDGLRRIGPTVTAELLGHGTSPAPADPTAYTPAAYLEHCEEVLARLGLTAAWWVGYSMGGFAALRLALARPQRVQGLVLIATGPGIEDAEQRAAKRRADLELAEGTEQHGMDWYFDRYYGQAPAVRTLPPEQLAALRARRTRNSAIGVANSMRGLGSGALEPVWHRLPEINLPTLVVCGTEDARFAGEAPQIAARLPRARLALIPGAGHSVVMQKPAELVTALTRFFAELP